MRGHFLLRSAHGARGPSARRPRPLSRVRTHTSAPRGAVRRPSFGRTMQKRQTILGSVGRRVDRMRHETNPVVGKRGNNGSGPSSDSGPGGPVSRERTHYRPTVLHSAPQTRRRSTVRPHSRDRAHRGRAARSRHQRMGTRTRLPLEIKEHSPAARPTTREVNPLKGLDRCRCCRRRIKNAAAEKATRRGCATSASEKPTALLLAISRRLRRPRGGELSQRARPAFFATADLQLRLSGSLPMGATLTPGLGRDPSQGLVPSGRYDPEPWRGPCSTQDHGGCTHDDRHCRPGRLAARR